MLMLALGSLCLLLALHMSEKVMIIYCTFQYSGKLNNNSRYISKIPWRHREHTVMQTLSIIALSLLLSFVFGAHPT